MRTSSPRKSTEIREAPPQYSSVYNERSKKYMHYGHNHRPRVHQLRDQYFIFYPAAWTDLDTGKEYRAGYYDMATEEFYATPEEGISIRDYLCEYCDTRVSIVPKDGVAAKCPNCGGNLTLLPPENEVPDGNPGYYIGPGGGQYGSNYAGYGNGSAPGRSGSRSVIIIIVTVFAVLALIVGGIAFSLGRNRQAQGGGTTGTGYTTENGKKSFYVEAIDRTCSWSNEYDSYYDEVTDCYFWHNEDVDPPIWQYWYEGISSDYGDYGWMEWDEEENRWYIDDGNDWIVLPEIYDTQHLWHIEE